jgi:hypothetical protein
MSLKGWNAFCNAAVEWAARSSGETHENLPVVAADERPVDGGSLHFRPGTTLENAFLAAIFAQ